VELWNLLTVSRLIVRSAMVRRESRGAHYRSDFPLRDDNQFQKHSVISKGSEVAFRELSLAKVMV
jgi:L-aspartate oxidase